MPQSEIWNIYPWNGNPGSYQLNNRVAYILHVLKQSQNQENHFPVQTL